MTMHTHIALLAHEALDVEADQAVLAGIGGTRPEAGLHLDTLAGEVLPTTGTGGRHIAGQVEAIVADLHPLGELVGITEGRVIRAGRHVQRLLASSAAVGHEVGARANLASISSGHWAGAQDARMGKHDTRGATHTPP